MGNSVCCFTGHRIIEPQKLARLSEVLEEIINGLIEKGTTTFRTGGAMGFDTLAALVVIDKKRENPDIKLELHLPCKEQACQWDMRSKEYYEYVLKSADTVKYVRGHYVKGCMHERNRALVNGADFCIAYCTHSGGSAYTVDYAKKKGLRVLNIAGLL